MMWSRFQKIKAYSSLSVKGIVHLKMKICTKPSMMSSSDRFGDI